ncbi:MAG: 2,3,4,5-tetrahydropyridine-2,6-dicarboxylate N-succinyltransferase [Candidatus Kapabacteria bacterium]|jgi:2,3,4,5-tetrahydropyridine-2-carboxylate N-succinyltransferase|nr:2,3,4,5-tetrahydropyridine-2,6-dicarboxylate N-succinyltransferase [Candidatus Kapabacteria bacterium]
MQEEILKLYENNSSLSEKEIQELLHDFTLGLNKGDIRSAEPDGNGGWQVNTWVKKGILLMFKHSTMTDMTDGKAQFFDKSTLPVHPFSIEDNIRIVPGGSSVRTGCYVAPGVICMPPMYINIGSYTDEGTMIDSHALVGTCAQLGKRIHLSAASQIGGVLEPMGARPVIVEDDVMIGGNCGVYEGTMIRKRAVLGSGVILTASTKVFDLVNERVLKATQDNPLEIPENAVVVPGSRKLSTDFGIANGLSIASPLIIKYRDDKTDARTALEDTLR